MSIALPKINDNETINEIKMLEQVVNGLLELNKLIKANGTELEEMLATLKKAEINNSFMTVADAAEALQCSTKRATEYLKQRNIEIIDAGKTYVIYKNAFIESFANGGENS